MKMLCTGNPAHRTVASAVQKKWPDADFASRATGYDLRFWDPGSETFFRDNIKKYDVFINSSFICGGGQSCLLETTAEEWSNTGVHGHIINVGSSAEFLGIDSQWGIYSIQKKALRERSLQLHGKNGLRCTHLILGGINDGKSGHESWLDLESVADTIDWIMQQSFCVPLVYIEAHHDSR